MNRATFSSSRSVKTTAVFSSSSEALSSRAKGLIYVGRKNSLQHRHLASLCGRVSVAMICLSLCISLVPQVDASMSALQAGRTSPQELWPDSRNSQSLPNRGPTRWNEWQQGQQPGQQAGQQQGPVGYTARNPNPIDRNGQPTGPAANNGPNQPLGVSDQQRPPQGIENRYNPPNVNSVDWSNRPTMTNPVPNGPVVVPPPELFAPSRILARVGTYTVFAGDLLPEINELIETKMAGAPDNMKSVQRERLMEQLLPKIVEQKLLYADAVNKLPDASKLDEVMVSIREQFVEIELPKLLEEYGVASASELDALLRQYGGSVRRRREKWAEGQLIGFVVRQNVDVDPEVTHQEMLDEYREHLSEYEIPAKVRWQQLMVLFSKYPSKQEAFREIASMGDEVVYGAPFEAVAKRRSQGFNSEEGGLHDWTTKGALKAKEVDKALFELPIGYLSDIIESDQGFHIIQVLERKQADYVSFREAQLEIRERIKVKRQEESLQEYLEGVKSRIPVWTFLDEKPQN